MRYRKCAIVSVGEWAESAVFADDVDYFRIVNMSDGVFLKKCDANCASRGLSPVIVRLPGNKGLLRACRSALGRIGKDGMGTHIRSLTMGRVSSLPAERKGRGARALR